jgi:hypothetical protein
VIREAGLEPIWITYSHFFVFPVALVWRLLSCRLGLGRFSLKHDFWTLPRPINAWIAGLYRVEAWLLGKRNLPWGVSVNCIADRPSEA